MASNSPTSAAICNICSNLYIDPRMLPCLHSFCCECLKKQGQKKNLICPACKKVAPLPAAGINALPKDLRKSNEVQVVQYATKIQSKKEISCDQCVDVINGPATMFCVECCEFLCKACTKHHKSWRKTLSHELVVVGGTEAEYKKTATPLAKIPHKPLNCPVHEDELLKFFCETCTTLICRDCMAIEHSGHSYDRLEKLAEKHKGQLQASLEHADSAKIALDDALAMGAKLTQCIQLKQISIEKDIKVTFKALIEAISKREKSLLARAAEVSFGKQTALSIQGEELSSLRKEIAATYEMITAAIQSYTAAEMLSAKGPMTSKLEQLLKQYRGTDLAPCRSDMMLSMLPKTELVEQIHSFGDILQGSCPSKAKIDLYLPTAVQYNAKKITITACGVNGQPFAHGGEKVEVALSLMGSVEPAITAKVVDNNDGTYSASFTPQNIGEHQLSITIDSMPINGSPFPLYARKKRDFTTLTSSQLTFSLSSQPYDVAVDDNGDVYVALFTYHCIEVYNKSGNRIRTIGTAGSPGNAERQFNSPSAIAIHGSILYVAEYNNNRVKKLTTSGEFLSVFGVDHLRNPRGICLDICGKVFVSCCGNNSVSIFEADGSHIFNISGKLNGPWGIAFDQSGNLNVADTITNTIKVFTPKGQYVTEYNSGVSQPAGIAIDDEGNTFVTEQLKNTTVNNRCLSCGNYTHNCYCGSMYNPAYASAVHGAYGSRLCILSLKHRVIKTIKVAQNAIGVTVDKEGSIYVCDYTNRKVGKY